MTRCNVGAETNGDGKTKSIEEAQTKIKALERGGVESHVSGDMQDIGRLRKKNSGESWDVILYI